MRITTFVSLLGVAALAAVAGCVKDVDQPALAGPSTFAHSIVMVADRDTLLQNGVDFTDIRITSLVPTARLRTCGRAQIYIDGVANDFGTLSTKSRSAMTIRYTAPPTAPVAEGPDDRDDRRYPASGGDFRGENTRAIDINLQPVGIIIPANPNPPGFALHQAPKVMDIVTFDAASDK
jgi:hypothetical protein